MAFVISLKCLEGIWNWIKCWIYTSLPLHINICMCMCALMLLGLYGKVTGTGCELLGWCDQCTAPDIRQQRMLCNEPLGRYVRLRVAHAPGMPGTFSHRGFAIPTCITACASRTCRDACRDRYLAVSFEVGDGENVPDIPGACATRNFTYLVRGP